MAVYDEKLVQVKHLQELASRTTAKINAAVSSAYKAAGSKAASELTNALLIAANQGKVYNLTTELEITNENKALFTENAVGSYPAGTNVVVAEGSSAHYEVTADTTAQEGKTYYTRSGEEGSYTFTPAEDLTADTDISGETFYELAAATYLFDVLAGFVDLSGYMTKVSGAVEGNLASFSSDGSVTDSGVAIATDAEVTSMLNSVFGASE